MTELMSLKKRVTELKSLTKSNGRIDIIKKKSE